MNDSIPPCTPFTFKPNSIYLLFIKLDGRCCSGVFHHSSNNRGRLAYAAGRMPGPQTSPRMVFLFERKLKQRIETEFAIITAYKVASIQYHRYDKWSSNPRFVPSDPDGIFVNEDTWLSNVLYDLDEKWKRNKLIWVEQDETPPQFEELARKHIPSVITVIQAFHLRRLLYGVAGTQKRSQELGLYTMDTWC